ncbi:hypothetical protein HP456_20080 [Bacillus haikouensis]|uniref:hypothetical protein n=1 Tax=Bacillus haikouensis TaxID=1510468 RepID=UPI0015533DD9|nr:hypothetical protein [Bacillus haikouensis]NQD68210.1 hypothetical protein [Bacillus haikouensis]
MIVFSNNNQEPETKLKYDYLKKINVRLQLFYVANHQYDFHAKLSRAGGIGRIGCEGVVELTYDMGLYGLELGNRKTEAARTTPASIS